MRGRHLVARRDSIVTEQGSYSRGSGCDHTKGGFKTVGSHVDQHVVDKDETANMTALTLPTERD